MLLARALSLVNFRVVALSRPGYLETSLRTGRTPEEQADLYAATLDALGIERAALIAISGGGPSAIRFALQYPDRCWALVLVSTIGKPMQGGLPFSFHLKIWLGRQTWFAERIRRRIERDPEAAAHRAIRDPDVRARTLADSEGGSLFRALLASSADRLPLRIAGTKQDVLTGRQTSPPLENVRVPTLVVHGTEDQVVPYAQHGAVLGRRIPRAELLTVEGGEHFAIFTHRELIRARVKAFLAKHAPAETNA